MKWTIAAIAVTLLCWLAFVGYQQSRSGPENYLIRQTADRLEVIDESPFQFSVGGSKREHRKKSSFDWFTITYRFTLQLPEEHRGAPHGWEPRKFGVWHHTEGAANQLPYRCENEAR
ncbi:MAG: hypothetical protein AAF585_12120 [Verrucomicrobiota bacterium]